MFIQGDLQAVFDALYTVGAIDPVLNSDWRKIAAEMESQPQAYTDAVRTINACSGDRQRLVEKLMMLDRQAVNFIAVEVAREFAEYTDRKAIH